MNAPPVGRRSARPAMMSYTLGPTTRPHRAGNKEQVQQSQPSLMSTIDVSRSSQVIPPLKDMLNTLLEPATLTTKEATLVNLLNDVTPRDIPSILADSPAPIHYDKICREILHLPLPRACAARVENRLTIMTCVIWHGLCSFFQEQQETRCSLITGGWFRTEAGSGP